MDARLTDPTWSFRHSYPSISHPEVVKLVNKVTQVEV